MSEAMAVVFAVAAEDEEAKSSSLEKSRRSSMRNKS